MQIIYNLPYVFDARGNTRDNAAALHVMLDGLVGLNLAWLRYHAAVPLRRAGVVYGRTLWWEPIPALYDRKFGDCKSLCAADIAQDIARGIDARPVFRFITYENGLSDYHILVMTAQGFKDPSKELGMAEYMYAPFYNKALYTQVGG